MRLLLILLAALALTGCWVGRSLYAASDARAFIPPGTYEAKAADAPKRLYKVTILPNGLTQFDSGEKKEVYGFAPLGPNTAIGWVQIEDAGADEVNQLYGLVVRQPGGAFIIYPPECKGEQAEVARKNGATVEEGSSPACLFTSRAGLEQAMRQVPRDSSQAMRLEPVR